MDNKPIFNKYSESIFKSLPKIGMGIAVYPLIILAGLLREEYKIHLQSLYEILEEIERLEEHYMKTLEKIQNIHQHNKTQATREFIKLHTEVSEALGAINAKANLQYNLEWYAQSTSFFAASAASAMILLGIDVSIALGPYSLPALALISFGSACLMIGIAAYKLCTQDNTEEEKIILQTQITTNALALIVITLLSALIVIFPIISTPLLLIFFASSLLALGLISSDLHKDYAKTNKLKDYISEKIDTMVYYTSLAPDSLSKVDLPKKVTNTEKCLALEKKFTWKHTKTKPTGRHVKPKVNITKTLRKQ